MIRGYSVHLSMFINLYVKISIECSCAFSQCSLSLCVCSMLSCGDELSQM